MPNRRPTGFAGRQTGATLVVSLILLLVLTILGVSASRGSLTEERMTGNTQDLNIAFQAAEGALREGEGFLLQPSLPYFDGTSGLYEPAPPTDAPIWSSVDWEDENEVREYEGLSGAPDNLSSAVARYIIEEMPVVAGPGESLAADAPVEDARTYRITAQGVGISGNSRVTLQSTFRR